MRWLAAMAFAALWAAGCRNAPPAFDPFLPKTRIPPPPTGAACGASDAYLNPTPSYTGAAPGSAPLQPGMPGPMGGSDLYGPPGGYSYPPSSLPPAAVPAPSASGVGPTPGPVNRSSQSAPAKQSQSGRQGVVLASGEPALPSQKDVYGNGNVRANYAAPSVDLMDLPPVARSQRQTVRKPPAEAASEDRYDYAADYHWLRGQLEYSPDGGPWKLRYIPLDGAPDDFGGSVLLDGKLPRQYRPGDFVLVEGQPESAGGAAASEALYRVAAIDRQAE